MASTFTPMREGRTPCRGILLTNIRRCQPHVPVAGFLFFSGTLGANTCLARNPHGTSNRSAPGANLRIRRALTAHLPRPPHQPQRPPRRQFFIAVTEKTCAGASMIGLPRLIALLDRRRGRSRNPPRDVRTIRLHPDDVNPAETGRAKLPIRPKGHAEAELGPVATSSP